jgi:hypothetical protein
MTEKQPITGKKKRGEGKPFQPGDPRINRKGRPRDIGKLRDLAQQISHEVIIIDHKPGMINGHLVTAAEAILRGWANSNDFRKQAAFMEYAYGKVPEPVDVTSKGEKIEFTVKYEDGGEDDEDTNNPETPTS